MKKLLFSLLCAAVIISTIVTSCKKEAFSPEDAYNLQKKYDNYKDSIEKAKVALAEKNLRIRDSLQKVSGVVNYTVAIIDAALSASGKKAGIDLTGADVTVSQFGKVSTAKTDANGRAFFTDLRSGTVDISVVLTGYSSVNVIADLGSNQDGNTLVRQVATQIPLLPTTGTSMATVTGTLTYEADLTNLDPEVLAGADVVMNINPNNFINQTNGIAGRIVKYNYTNMLLTTKTDATGKYSFLLPVLANGQLQYSIEVPPVVKDQTLLLNTVNNQPVFGPQVVKNVTFGSAVFNDNIPLVSAAYAEISAPTGLPYNGNGGAGTVVLGGGTIVSIGVSNNTYAYSQPPVVKCTDPTGTGLQTTVNMNPDKTIGSISIVNGGDNYSNNPNIYLEDHDAVANNLPSNVDYSTRSYHSFQIYGGYSFASTVIPSITVDNGTTGGTGLKLTPIYELYPNGTSTYYFVYRIQVDNPGAGYKSLPVIKLNGKDIVNTSLDYIVTIDQNNANIETRYSLSEVKIAYGGANYTTAPFANFQNTGTVYRQPNVTTVMTGGSISSLTITDGGEFSSQPWIDFKVKRNLNINFPQLASLTNIRIQKYVSKITVTDPGNSFTAAPNLVLTPTNINTTEVEKATATATVANGVITGFTVTTPGKYIFNSGNNPSVNLTLSNKNVTPKQAYGYVSVNSLGQVTGVNLNAGSFYNVGAGYTSLPTITIKSAVTGKGTGAIAKVTSINSSDGSIPLTGIVLENGGSGYLGLNYKQGNVIYQDVPNNFKLAPGATSTYNIYLGSGKRPVTTVLSK